jgi:hypothetical protein
MVKSSCSIVAKNVRAWCIFGTIPGNIMAIPLPPPLFVGCFQPTRAAGIFS